MPYVAAAVLLLLGLGVSGFFVYEATARTITPLEGVLFQFFALAAGLTGSFIFGKQSARAAAQEIIKPHARSAFRRLTSLYLGLSKIAGAIKAARNLRSDSVELAELDGLVMSQLATADDALEDWRDIVPKELDDLRQRLSASSSDEG